MARTDQILSKPLFKIIKIYQLFFSPLLGQCCRFYPSCSKYLCEAIAEYGFWKGIGYGLCRLLKCHPFHKGGFDPVKKDTNENLFNISIEIQKNS